MKELITFFLFCIFCWMRLPIPNQDPLVLDASALVNIFSTSISAESNTALLFLMLFFFPMMELTNFFLFCIFCLMRLPMPNHDPLALDASMFSSGDSGESNTALLFLMLLFFPMIELTSFLLFFIFWLILLPMPNNDPLVL